MQPKQVGERKKAKETKKRQQKRVALMKITLLTDHSPRYFQTKNFHLETIAGCSFICSSHFSSFSLTNIETFPSSRAFLL